MSISLRTKKKKIVILKLNFKNRPEAQKEIKTIIVIINEDVKTNITFSWEVGGSIYRACTYILMNVRPVVFNDLCGEGAP